MRRIQYHSYGEPEQLRLEQVELPKPGGGEVRVQVKAAGANPMDWKIRKGEMKFITGKRFPRGLGHDFAGIVDAVGLDVRRLKVGDAVFGATTLKEAGAFADAVVTAENNIVMKPPSLSFEHAGSLIITSVTAWTALINKAHLEAGQSIFIAGCLGGVGRAATQIAMMQGAEVTGSCSRSRRDESLALGVSEAVDYGSFDAASYKRRFDVVFDTHGALSFGTCAMMLKSSGVALHIVPTPLKFLRSVFSRRHTVVIANPKTETMTGVGDAIGQGKITPEIGRIAPLSEAVTAITELERTGIPKGKLVIVP